MNRRAGLALALLGLLVLLAPACTRRGPAAPPSTRKIGVLLVSHGSLSETWRKALTDLGDRVRPRVLKDGRVAEVKSAFMEYTEPSIATRLEEFDAAAFSDVVIVPVFLTVSPHPFDDIPTIIGQKTDPQSLETLKVEGIRRYTPRARTHLTPLLDFTTLLQENLLRRTQALSKEPRKEGVVFIAYGDSTYEKEWAALLDKVALHVKSKTGIEAHSHGWCGHLVHYDPAKTTAAIQQVLATKERALVVPVLVAHDERFQIKLIGKGIDAVPGHETKVVYKPDSILPDPGVEQWIEDVSRSTVAKIVAEATR